MTEETLGADLAHVTTSTHAPDLRQSTQSLIGACSDQMFTDKYKWDVLLDHWNAVITIIRHNNPDYDEDDTTKAHYDLESALMAMPSPDAAALRWKLDYFLAPIGGGSTDSYSADFVAQTVADYRRFLAAEPIADLVPAPARIAWDAALEALASRESAVEAPRIAFNRVEAVYFRLRPRRLTIDEIVIPVLDAGDGLDGLEKRVAAIEADFKQRDDLAKIQVGYTDAETAYRSAIEAQSSALAAMLACPAPDLAAVVHKLEIARKECMEIEDIDPVLADLRRLMGDA